MYFPFARYRYALYLDRCGRTAEAVAILKELLTHPEELDNDTHLAAQRSGKRSEADPNRGCGRARRRATVLGGPGGLPALSFKHQFTSQEFIDSPGCFFLWFFNSLLIISGVFQLSGMNRVSVEGEVRDANGNLITTYTAALQALTQALMWAPPGTFVQCQILAAGDCTCEIVTDPITGEQLICSQVKVCKEIQVKALVKLLVPSYGFCELDPCIPVPQPEFPCPPEPIFPPQRCQEPPLITILEVVGTGIPNVDVTLRRKVDATTIDITKRTDASGNATFAEVGGFAGSLDDIIFTGPVTGKTITFHVPVEFTDTAGVVHDSRTACVIVFQRTLVGVTTFNVTIDGFTLATPVDP